MNTTGNETNGIEFRKLRRPSSAERERVLAEWTASGRTKEEMAAATGWSPHTLYRWWLQANNVKPKRTPKPMLNVPPPAQPVRQAWAAEIMIGAGATSVRLSPSCAPSWAGELVRALKPC